MEYVMVSEGKAKLLVPKPELYLRSNGIYEPSWAPVFYNPRATLSRDLSVLTLVVVTKHFGLNSLTVADVLAGTGVRGIRYTLEVPNISLCIINDIDPKAVKIIKENVAVNNLGNRIRIYQDDANELLYRLKREGVKLGFIDVDPYGSPAPYIQSALWCTIRGGFVGFTATDVAALSGSRPHAGSRRYSLKLTKTDFKFEVGLRALLSYIARRAAEAERYVEPILGVLHSHYYRVIVRVGKGAKRAQKMLEDSLGYVYYCENCLFRGYSNDISMEMLRCPVCGLKTEILGPLWISEVVNRDVVSRAVNQLVGEYSYLPTSKEAYKLLNMVKDEVNVPFYYDLVSLASKYRLNVPGVNYVISYLREVGYKASRTHFLPTGIKTDANYDAFVNAVKRSFPKKPG